MLGTAVGVVDRQPAGRERPAEHDPRRALRDVDEPADTDRAVGKLADVDVAAAVGLAEPEERDVEQPAVVQVHHGRHADHGVVADRRAEHVAAGGDPADDAVLDRRDHVPVQATLPQHRRHRVGDTDADVADVARGHLAAGPPGDHRARVQRQGGRPATRVADSVPRVILVELVPVRLPLLRVGHHPVEDRNPGHLDRLRVQPPRGALAHLRDGHASAGAGGRSELEHVQVGRLVRQGQVPVLVSRARPDEGHVDPE